VTAARGEPEQAEGARPAGRIELDPEIAKVVAAMNALPGTAEDVPIEQARAGHETETAELSGPGQAVGNVHDQTIPGPAGEIAVRVYTPVGEHPLPVVGYFHGGGWAIGSLDSFDTVARALANAACAIVVSVDYRLAPEHPFPAAVDDCLAATRWLAASASSLSGDPGRLALAGDSAGANLATVVARRLRDEGDSPVRFQALIYPAIDARLNTPSYRDFAEGYGLTALSMKRFWGLYLDGADGADPDASPLRAGDLSGLPPAFVLTAEADVLRDEGEAYAERLREAGVEVTLRRFDGATHGFWRWQAKAALSRRAVREVGAALHEAL
jgi:acetyl esterase/lipase